jgi:hypothetical protein
MAVTDWSTTASSNTTVGGINIAENCSPANMNNAVREMMAQIATRDDELVALIGGGTGTFQPLDAGLTSISGLTTAADKFIYTTASDTYAVGDITSYGRTLLGLASAAALKAQVGSMAVLSSSIAGNGYVELDFDGDSARDLLIQWGSGTIGSNTTGTISFPIAFTTFGRCVASGGTSSVSREGSIHNYGSTGLTSQTIINSAAGGTSTYNWVAFGK